MTRNETLCLRQIPLDLRRLRLKYNVAWDTHAECARATRVLQLRSEQLPPKLIEQEGRARFAMEAARDQLRVVIVVSITGHHEILRDQSAGPLSVSEPIVRPTSGQAPEVQASSPSDVADHEDNAQ